MSKGLIIGLIAAGVIVVGGGAAYMLTRDDESSNDTSQSSNDDVIQPISFSPNWSDDQAFVATISSNGKETGRISSNGQGTISFATTKDGEESRFIYTSDAYYACQGDNCIKYPLSQASASAFDPSQYQYGEDRINGLRSLTSYKGQETCGTSTCDVWEYSEEGSTTTLYLDASNKRIVRVKHVSANQEESDISYEYKNVTIAIPENAQEINIPNASQ